MDLVFQCLTSNSFFSNISESSACDAEEAESSLEGAAAGIDTSLGKYHKQNLKNVNLDANG